SPTDSLLSTVGGAALHALPGAIALPPAGAAAVPDAGLAPRVQLTMSPYYGKSDFSGLSAPRARARLDPVSIADLLRNGFVYPPHSIFQDVKLVTFSFDPAHDMHDAPQFRFVFREDARQREAEEVASDWVGEYHRLLCDAVATACRDMRAPWLLQSGGKDSTSIAIAAAEARPDMRCITYHGGPEENEVESARAVAATLGLRHETLECDPGRAYDRYLALVDRMPLLTADFALLSYVDLATQVAVEGGDGIVDGMCSDNYFGFQAGWKHRWLSALARGLRLPGFLSELPLVGRNFELCYVLSTLQMDRIERAFPGSRFTDAEVDALFGHEVSRLSRARLELFRAEMESANSVDEWWAIASSIAGSSASVGKGLYTTAALSLQAAYPFCDRSLCEWVFRQVPQNELVDPAARVSKLLMRKHIATRFGRLPYVVKKGSFRFDLCGLARGRFEQVHDFALQVRHVLPGAAAWLERNRARFDNKYHSSKFYLLAVVLPWIAARQECEAANVAAGKDA
ncbi:MAG TPA: asparagine synthase-related protein, partial [Xanthomonadaceae bacterium]|nr:asparagine synthase-related protein [Xanthomonadaceae bacterium]